YFTTVLSGLSSGQKYYVRFYAENEAGMSYGNVVEFTTLSAAHAPTVSTASVTEITETSAKLGGTITSDGGKSVTSKGFCWSATNAEPTVNDSRHEVNGNGTYFTTVLSGLSSGQKYYVRFYAENEAGISYGNVVEFATVKRTVTTLGVTVNGVPMSDTNDYTLKLTLDDFRTVVPGDLEAHVYAMEPEVFVSSSVAQTVFVTAEDLDRIEGKTVEGNAQICFGGQCEPLEARNDYTVTKNKYMAAGSSLDTETHISFGSVLFFDGEIFDGKIPTFPVVRRIRLTVKAGSEVFSFVLTFVCDPDNVY
ncbi:MAG: fibronectin type III domain-containing protein, partial [Bacteroides sp.]|nr:fibronectin type III domain-containing protein [Bacteroides sp.]